MKPNRDSWKIVKARKPHACTVHRKVDVPWVAEPLPFEIEEGHHHLFRSRMEAGKWYSERVCLQCALHGVSDPETRKKLEKLLLGNQRSKVTQG